jgi:SAM-dependent methyltransferase
VHAVSEPDKRGELAEPSEPHKRAEIASRTPEFIAAEASKPFGWSPAHFLEWATIATMIEATGVAPASRFIDLGTGSGWTTLFLAEAGYEVVGYDLVPANVELARRRAARWQSSASFEVADIESLPPGDVADAALLFDALHHSAHQADVLRSITGRLRPGGWLFIGEPTWLHRFSPAARAVRREKGWLERGLTVRGLSRDLRATGFTEMRRFFGPTAPYAGRGRGFAWQLARLVAANTLAAPHSHLWLAARLGSPPAGP